MKVEQQKWIEDTELDEKTDDVEEAVELAEELRGILNKYHNFKDSCRYLENIVEDLQNEQSKIDEESKTQMGKDEEDMLMTKNLFGIESYKLRR